MQLPAPYPFYACSPKCHKTIHSRCLNSIRPAIKSHSAISQLQLRRRTGVADNGNLATASVAGRASTPDPWLTSETSTHESIEALKGTLTAGEATPSNSVGVLAGLTSPWETPSTTNTSHTVQAADNQPSEPNPVAAAAGVVTDDLKDPLPHGSTAAAPSPHPLADGTGGGVRANASVSGVAAGNTSTSVNGDASGGGGKPSVGFAARAANAGLSEDTAALLSRLRAELARTNSMPMPPRRTPSTTSTASNTSTTKSLSASEAAAPAGGVAADGGVASVAREAAAAAANAVSRPPSANSAALAGGSQPSSGMSTAVLAAALAAVGAMPPETDQPAATSDPTAKPPAVTTISATAPAPASSSSGSSSDASGTSPRTIVQPGSTGSSNSGSSNSGSSNSGSSSSGSAPRPLSSPSTSSTPTNSTTGPTSATSSGRTGGAAAAGSLAGGSRDTYRKTFAALGTSLAQQVPMVRVTPAAYRVFFQGAGSLDLLYDVQRMVEQLEGVEKGAGGQYLDWLATARAALELGVEGFIARDAEGLGDLVGRALQDGELRSLLGSVGLGELLGSHHERMSRRFRDPRLRALFTFQDLYVGLSPYTAPGVYSLLAATELTEGVWYPLGGFGQIRDALVRVGQGLGVRHRCGARVTSIRTAPGSSGSQVVTGVALASGEELQADVVLSNRDVPLTYELLSGPAAPHGAATSRRLLTTGQYSAGVIAFNWSLNRRLEQLAHHNVFLSGDFAGSWDRATSPDTLARHPNFYVHCPSRTDPTAAPPGADSLMVLLPVGNIQEILRSQAAVRRRLNPLAAILPEPLVDRLGAATTAPSITTNQPAGGGAATATTAPTEVDYAPLVAAGREAVLRALAEAGLADVRQAIVDELVIDPVEWRNRYSLAHGAAFGLSHGLNQLSVFRPGLADQQVRGLYLVGASTRPGNGVPLTMISADLVVQRVLKDVAAGVL